MSEFTYRDLFDYEDGTNDLLRVPKIRLENIGLDDFSGEACIRAGLVVNCAKSFFGLLAEKDNIPLKVGNDFLLESQGKSIEVLLVETSIDFPETEENKMGYFFLFAFQEDQIPLPVDPDFLSQDSSNLYIDLSKLQAMTPVHGLFQLLNFFYLNPFPNILVSKLNVGAYYVLDALYEVLFEVVLLVPSELENLFLEEIVNA